LDLMSVTTSQQQTFLRLAADLRPHWRRDVNLPSRIQSLFAQHKEFGSRDRRLYRELIYTTVRYLAWIEPLLDVDTAKALKAVSWLAAETKDTTSYRAETSGDWPGATTLTERASFLAADPTLLLPPWFRNECPAVFASPELDALLARAPLWLRLQTDDRAAVAAEFESKNWRSRQSDILPDAWQLLDEADVTQTEAFARGAFEVQDLGSQLVLESVGIGQGGHWLDGCAGAGGKSLQLARLLGPKGKIDAYDTRPDALTELVTRANRVAPVQDASPDEGGAVIGDITSKGFAAIRVLPAPPGSRPARRAPKTAVPEQPTLYDGVLVDAPCSGSGTWRRAPHLKWATSPKVVADRAVLQQTLLERYSAFVKPGGQLVYATCSLARRENEGVVTAFLAGHPEFESAAFARTFGIEPGSHGLTILPSRHDTDGFFVATLRRR
jgi:16S rRNA (cytosine967-C5)-methyltransferase